MILTITMNPSIDISYPLDDFKLDTVNRVKNVRKTAGGKGLNVTRILKQLDAKVVASGLIGGFLGEEIKKDLTSNYIAHDFLPISGETRNCIAVLHKGQQTEILESGSTGILEAFRTISGQSRYSILFRQFTRRLASRFLQSDAADLSRKTSCFGLLWGSSNRGT